MKTLIKKIPAYLIAAILVVPLIADDAWARRGGGGGGGHEGITAARVSGDVLVPPSNSLWNNATASSFSLKFINSTGGGMGGGGMGGGGDGGTGGTMTVKAIHNGTDIAFLLSWNDATKNDTVNGVEEFSDRAGIMFSAEMMCKMGSPSNPVNIWFWHASKGTVNNIIAGGLGTITKTGEDNISVISEWSNGNWQVVMSRPLTSIDLDNQVDLNRGNGKMSFARWDGDNQERNGKKWITGHTSLTLQ